MNDPVSAPNGRCRAYLRSRGLFTYHGRRCERPAGHPGQHETARNGIGSPFTMRWGRVKASMGGSL